MKATLYDMKGKKKGDIKMPSFFSTRIRRDVVAKYFESEKMGQPFATDKEAGRKHSASGTISHKRHDWKGHYGKGISRMPRKTMWRRGTQFFWIGAEVSSARGGRRAHPPKGVGKEKKINRKEVTLAMYSAFAATGNDKYIVERYGRVEKTDVKVPIVIESNFDKAKTKDLISMFKNIFGDLYPLILKKKSVRAGKGKLRGRKYRGNAGLLLIVGDEEVVKMKGIDIKSVKEVSVGDLYPLGRLTAYTENAVLEMGGEK